MKGDIKDVEVISFFPPSKERLTAAMVRCATLYMEAISQPGDGRTGRQDEGVGT